MSLVGVDGCPGGWVAAIAHDSSSPITIAVAPTLDTLLDLCGEVRALAIDMPIGLPETGRRRCDVEARQLLGKRCSTLFFAPPRCVLNASSHREACDQAAKATGKRISIQAWNLVPKIRELDAFLQSHPTIRSQCHETHPELAFLSMAGGTAVQASKHIANGRAERRQLLAKKLGPKRFAGALEHAMEVQPKPPLIDQIDALACLATAMKIVDGGATHLPRAAIGSEPRITY